jgi:hypothetical protein
MTRARFAGSSTLAVAAVLAISVLALCGPLLTHGPLPVGSDIFSTSHYLQGFMKAFAEGDLYPRWTDRTNQGLGAPSFVLLTPLAYYAAGAAAWLTGSLITGFKLYLLVVAVLTALSMYALAREWIGPGLPAAVASGLYLLLPYHVLDMYQRFAVSETTAFIFLPLILLFARRSVRGGGPFDFAGLSLSYAALIYTHLVSTLMFSLFLGLWLLWETGGRWRALLPAGLALSCGVALAAPALLPAMLEKAHANISWVREMPNGDFRINFIFRDEVLPGLGIRDPVKPPVLKSAHSQLALAAAALGLVLAGLAAEQRRKRSDALALGAGCALTYLMQLGISTPIWRLVPELATIQFPWRFQTLMVLATALLAGLALSALWQRGGGIAPAGSRLVQLGSAVLVGLILLNLALAGRNAYLKPFVYDETRIQSAGVVQWVEPAFTPVEFTLYRRFKELQVKMPRAFFRDGRGDVSIAEWTSSSRKLELDSESGGRIGVRSFWFPGWRASIDGEPLEVTGTPPGGTLAFEVPPGRHTVKLRFEATPARRAAAWVGLAALLAMPILALGSTRLRAKASGYSEASSEPGG